jgi:hypothetical protein
VDAVGTRKIFIAQGIARAGCAWPRVGPLESKFHRDSDFETPVAIFVLQIERDTVTSGIVVDAIEQAEPIKYTLVDGTPGYPIVAVIEIETSLCRCGCRR